MNPRPSLLHRLDGTGMPLLVARLILGCAFIYMGWMKAWEPVHFLKLIRQYELVPDDAHVLLNSMAVALPWLEILCGALLLAGVLVRGAALTLLLMLTVFTLAIADRALGIYHSQSIAFCDIKFDCGCGTGIAYVCHKIPENIALWLLALLALLSRSRRFCLLPLKSSRRAYRASKIESAPEPG